MVLPIFNNQQKQVGLRQASHVIEATHARTTHISDEKLRLIRAQNRGIHRIPDRVLNTTIVILERGYGTSILVIVVLVLWINWYALQSHQGLVRRNAALATEIDILRAHQKAMPVDEVLC